jgi:riboflavin kinase/FMN adenylyltransferase
MTIFRSLAEVPAAFGTSVVTIGNFDGVHVGHRRIMRRVVEIARARQLTAAVLTFDPHPARVLAPDRAPKLIMTVPRRLRSIESEGIDAVLVLPFSLEFARLTPEEFVGQVLLETLHARVIVVGEDFRFGHKQAGNVETLRALGGERRFEVHGFEVDGFEVETIGTIERCQERVSSSTVRRLLAEGRVSRACRELGAPFALEGDVVSGQGIGSKQTVPTLNLASLNEVLPKNGVYVTRTRDLDSGRRWRSITNVGYRPTFDGAGLTIETFLLDPLADAGPRRIEVSFLAFIRDERKFENPEALKAQILRDVGVASRLHRRLEKLHVG